MYSCISSKLAYFVGQQDYIKKFIKKNMDTNEFEIMNENSFGFI